MKCVLSKAEIPQRTQRVARILRRIAPPRQRVACWPRWLDRQVVLSAYIGAQPTDPDPDQWRFPTKVSQIRASYYERWVQADSITSDVYLERAYLHLFIRKEERSEKEVLALHCDPNDSQSSKHYFYKAGPHFHMTTAENPLRHCHIALNTSNLSDVLKSVDGITKALETAITMIEEQVLGLDWPHG